MSYKLEKPYTNKEKSDFIVNYNHNKNLRIEETKNTLFALEAWEKIVNDEVLENKEEFEKKQKLLERERLDKLSLTGADVERAIYQTKGMDFENILNMAKDNPRIDSKALKIELKANNFYRGNPYINQIGTLLGFSEIQLDRFFETNDYTELLPIEEDMETMEALNLDEEK